MRPFVDRLVGGGPEIETNIRRTGGSPGHHIVHAAEPRLGKSSGAHGLLPLWHLIGHLCDSVQAVIVKIEKFAGWEGRFTPAAKSYTRALALVTNGSERRFLERRLREVHGKQQSTWKKSYRELEIGGAMVCSSTASMTSNCR